MLLTELEEAHPNLGHPSVCETVRAAGEFIIEVGPITPKNQVISALESAKEKPLSQQKSGSGTQLLELALSIVSANVRLRRGAM